MKPFQLTLGYALRTLYFIDENEKQVVNGMEISEALGISYNYLLKVFAKLMKGNLITSEQGCNGGYRMLRDLDDIPIYDVVCAVEGNISFYKKPRGLKKFEGEGDIIRYFNVIQRNLEYCLKSVSVKALFHDNSNIIKRIRQSEP